MNSFRVISNIKLIASNVCTKKTTSIFAHGFRPASIILRFFNRHVYFLLSELTFESIIFLVLIT